MLRLIHLYFVLYLEKKKKKDGNDEVPLDKG